MPWISSRLACRCVIAIYGCVAAAVASNRAASIDPFDMIRHSEAHTIKHQSLTPPAVFLVLPANDLLARRRRLFGKAEIFTVPAKDIDPINY